MKLVQLNMWAGRLDRPILELFNRERPDILCLQELISVSGSTAGLFLTLDDIQKEFDYYHAFYSPVFTFNFMRRQANFGNAILSKYPLVNSEVIFTHGEHTPDYDYLEDSTNIRNLQYAQLDTPHGNLHILNHHGHRIAEHKNGDAETMCQCKIIADYVGKLEGKIILTGDFNLVPTSPSLDPLNSLLTNLTARSGVMTTRNELTHKTEVCDYIFISDEVKFKSFRVDGAIVSDHQALILEFS